MSNSLKGLTLAAGVIITCMVISIGFFVAKEAKNIASEGMEQMSYHVAEMKELSNSSIDFYNGMVLSGSEAERLVNRFYEKMTVKVKKEGASEITVSKENLASLSLSSNESYLVSLDYDEKGNIECMTFTQT